MARRKLAGPGKLGTMRNVKKSLSSGRRNANVKDIPGEGGITTRLLDDPHEMYGYYQHWTPNGPIPCVEGDCEWCDDDDDEVRKRQFKYLANAYVVDEQKVMVVRLPKTAFEQLVGYYEKYGTLKDRDYDLTKRGSGREGTKYSASPDSPSRLKLDRFKKHDLEAVAMSMLGEDVDDEGEDYEDEEEEQEETPRRRTKKRTEPRSTKKRRVVYDDDEEDEDDEEPPRRRVVKKSSAKRTVKSRTSGLDEFDRKTSKNPSRKSTTTRRVVRRGNR